MCDLARVRQSTVQSSIQYADAVGRAKISVVVPSEQLISVIQRIVIRQPFLMNRIDSKSRSVFQRIAIMVGTLFQRFHLYVED